MAAETVENQLLESLNNELYLDHSQRLKTLPSDYFSWGRDQRHAVDDTEKLDLVPRIESIKGLLGAIYRRLRRSVRRYTLTLGKYESFNGSYLLMSDEASRRLFSELLVMQIRGEERYRLSTFDDLFVSKYEEASVETLASEQSLRVYHWLLKRIDFSQPSFSIFTTPVLTSLIKQGRAYRYSSNGVEIDVEENDVVIDCGVGWGDTTIYFAAKAGSDGAVYSFDVLEEAMDALHSQLALNPSIKNVTSVLSAVSDIDGNDVYVSSPSPGAHITSRKTGRKVKTLTLDSFVDSNTLPTVDFIKMDIEGAEFPALTGARKTIEKYKPKLAISAYHRWDDLRELPRLVNSIRDDYSFYLDCTTGFGGEVVLYCR